jgi:hypothetical protein
MNKNYSHREIWPKKGGLVFGQNLRKIKDERMRGFKKMPP